MDSTAGILDLLQFFPMNLWSDASGVKRKNSHNTYITVNHKINPRVYVFSHLFPVPFLFCLVKVSLRQVDQWNQISLVTNSCIYVHLLLGRCATGRSVEEYSGHCSIWYWYFERKRKIVSQTLIKPKINSGYIKN